MNAADTTQDSVFTLLRRADLRATRGEWAALALYTVIGWLGATAFIGQYRRNEVARLVETLVPGSRAFWAMLVTAIAVAAVGYAVRRTRFAHGAAIIAGFLGGHALYEQLYPLAGIRFVIPLTTFSDGVHFAVARLLWAVCVGAVCVPLWYATFARQPGEPRGLTLGWGDWRIASRDFSSKRPPEPYSRVLFTGYFLFMAILFVLMQANVGFRPIRSGALLALLPAILLSAVANSAAEEFVFRGAIQPAFIRVGGIAAGLWMQGFLFGLMHWGTSVGVLAALPVSLAIGLGSVVWGKAALETRGLGWVMTAHAMVDVAVMSAFFVR